VAQTQLNQIVALEKGVKARAHADFTAAHNQLQKTALLSGISRTYKPKDEEGEQMPPESTRVQVRVAEVMAEVRQALTRLFDVILTKDVANGAAKADIVVDGTTIATEVPVTYLLFLEKQLTDLLTFVTKIPVLDAAESWAYDEATEKHPAQVEMYFEDVLVGYWTTVKYSGALPQARINELKARVVRLGEAVKVAREKANSTEVTDQKIGEKVFDYLFA